VKREKWIKWARWAGVLLLLALLWVQMAASSAQKSAAFDETYHLVSGYAYLRTGSPRLSWQHPPLADTLAALPLLARSDLAPFPYDHPAWQNADPEAFVDDYLWVDNFPRAAELIWAGRQPLMALAVLFGLALFVALRSIAGEAAAWIGLVLFTLDPNVVANGRLITTDLPLAGFLLLAVWRLGAYLRRPSGANLLWAGLAAGLALSTKFSAVLLAPIFLLTVLIYRPREGHALPLWRRLLALAGMAALAALTVWASYSFEMGPLGDGGIALPAPTFLHGLPRVWERIARGTPTYLFGQISDSGWWHYFLTVFALKTPLPTLILLAAGLIATRNRWREQALWAVPAALYLIVASSSTLQIGYRHVLPVLLFAIPLAASAFPDWPRARLAQAGLALLGAWLVAEAAIAFPHHISYVNELGGGVGNGWRIFADMNVDWGQDLVALDRIQEREGMDDLHLAYFGSAYPSAYGVQAHMLPSFSRLLAGPEVSGFNPYTPEPGTYALSATSLHLGLIYHSQDLYASFRGRVPAGQAGRSILLYEVDYPPETPVDRAVVIGPDIRLLSPQELGLEQDHRLIAKWAGPEAFVLAAGGPARYVVRAPVPASPLVDAVLASGPLVDARPLLARIPDSEPASTPQGESLFLPAAFQDGPALAGWSLPARRVTAGEELVLTTYWRVEGPLTLPLAVFIHLLGEDGLPIAQWDGWPVAIGGLEQGDIVVLTHPLSVPAGAAAGRYPLQAGLYRPPHGPRLYTGEADRLILKTIEVEAR